MAFLCAVGNAIGRVVSHSKFVIERTGDFFVELATRVWDDAPGSRFTMLIDGAHSVVVDAFRRFALYGCECVLVKFFATARVGLT